jgi:hypothetical protein
MDSITTQVLLDMERTAQVVINQRQQIIEYDKQRQSNREAITALKKVAPSASRFPSVSSAKRPPIERDSWYLLGNCFIQMPTTQVIDILSTEQQHIEQELEKTNRELKKNVEQLLLLEGLQDDFAGFNLKPMNK